VTEPLSSLDDQGPWRAGVEDNPVTFTIDVVLGRLTPGGAPVYVTGITADAGVVLVQGAEDARPEAVLRLPDGLARALTDALVRHYGGTTDVRTLRRDYVNERGRVDRLIAALVDAAAGDRAVATAVARELAARPPVAESPSLVVDPGREAMPTGEDFLKAYATPDLMSGETPR
jgi:hypothetical protein